MSSVGERLRKARIKKGLKQAEVAKRLGVTRSVISRYELGINDPPSENIIKLAEIYGVSPNYLLGFKEEKTANFPDLEAPLREKNRADALNKISEIVRDTFGHQSGTTGTGHLIRYIIISHKIFWKESDKNYRKTKRHPLLGRRNTHILGNDRILHSNRGPGNR